MADEQIESNLKNSTNQDSEIIHEVMGYFFKIRTVKQSMVSVQIGLKFGEKDGAIEELLDGSGPLICGNAQEFYQVFGVQVPREQLNKIIVSLKQKEYLGDTWDQYTMKKSFYLTTAGKKAYLQRELGNMAEKN
jgi:hypothetical protein